MMKTTKVTTITPIERVNSEAFLYEISFADSTSALMLCREGDAMQYLNQDVDVDFREDMYKGKICSFVNTIAQRMVVNTITRQNNVKLFSETFDPASNVVFADINIGDTVRNAIVYCNKVKFDSSLKADWIDLTVSDKNRRVSHIRIFSPDTENINFAGRYIKCDLRKNKYGLSTQDIVCCEGELPSNPEVDIAESYIVQTFNDNAAMKAMLDSSNVLAFMKEYIGFEKGSLLLTAAMEIDIAKELTNVTPSVNVDELMRAFICDKLWVLNASARYPREFLCIHTALRYKEAFPPNTIDIICEKPANESPEREVYLRVKELVATITKMRKGEVELD